MIVFKKPKGNKGKRPNESVSYSVPEFLALVMSHIPSPYESLVFYYGLYSSSHSGKEKREQAEVSEAEVVESEGIQGITAGGKIHSSWARLIRKVFEVDPLCCTQCGGEMRMIAFIQRESETKKILSHIDGETIRPPPLKHLEKIKVEEVACEYTNEYLPTADDYLCDPIYSD